jgi:ribosome biogenesis GTPase
VTHPDLPHLASLGWDATWAAAFRAAAEASSRRGADAVLPARVVAEHRERYTISVEDGDASAVLAGRTRHLATAREELPAVGDWVGVARNEGEGTAIIRFVVPRRGEFVRKTAGDTTAAQVVAANVDVALVATALPGDLSTRRLERYLTLAWESGATPVVVLTKRDLTQDIDAAIAEAVLSAPGVDVVAVSAVTGDGVDRLAARLVPRRTAVLLGSSGAGKSTLVNRLLGEERQRTAAVRDDGKGRHTTTHRELVSLANGALLIDTPGMRELQLWNADDGLDSAFADLAEFAEQCRFRDCVHESEPGCAVRAALESGELPERRWTSYVKLQREARWMAMRHDARLRAEERSKWKRITKDYRNRPGNKP